MTDIKGPQQQPFAKTSLLTDEDMEKLIQADQYGVRLVMKNLPVGRHVVMKIIKPVWSRTVPSKEDPSASFTYYYLGAQYFPRGDAEGFPLDVQIGQSAAARLQESFPNETYVDMLAYFKTTKYGATFPQFINPFKGEQRVIKSKEDLFHKKASAPAPVTISAPTEVIDTDAPQAGVAIAPLPFSVPLVAVASIDRYIAREDIQTVVNHCIAQKAQFAHTFSQSVVVDGKTEHPAFQNWINQNIMSGAIGVKLTSAEIEALYAFILAAVQQA